MRGAALGAEVALLLPQARHMHGETSDVLGYGHFILVDDDDKTQSGTHVVECLVDHAACKGTVTHDCHRPGIRAHHPIRLRKAQRRRQGRGTVPRAEAVILALRAFGEAGYPAPLTQCLHPLVAPRQHLVDVALVSDIENEVVARAVEHPVHRHGQLHHAEIGGEVPPGSGNGTQQFAADFPAQLRHFVLRKRLEVGGHQRGSSLEQHRECREAEPAGWSFPPASPQGSVRPPVFFSGWFPFCTSSFRRDGLTYDPSYCTTYFLIFRERTSLFAERAGGG